MWAVTKYSDAGPCGALNRSEDLLRKLEGAKAEEFVPVRADRRELCRW